MIKYYCDKCETEVLRRIDRKGKNPNLSMLVDIANTAEIHITVKANDSVLFESKGIFCNKCYKEMTEYLKKAFSD